MTFCITVNLVARIVYVLFVCGEMLKNVLKNIRRYALANTRNLSNVQAACALSEPLTALALPSPEGAYTHLYCYLISPIQRWSNLVNCTESA